MCAPSASSANFVPYRSRLSVSTEPTLKRVYMKAASAAIAPGSPPTRKLSTCTTATRRAVSRALDNVQRVGSCADKMRPYERSALGLVKASTPRTMFSRPKPKCRAPVDHPSGREILGGAPPNRLERLSSKVTSPPPHRPRANLDEIPSRRHAHCVSCCAMLSRFSGKKIIQTGAEYGPMGESSQSWRERLRNRWFLAMAAMALLIFPLRSCTSISCKSVNVIVVFTPVSHTV